MCRRAACRTVSLLLLRLLLRPAAATGLSLLTTATARATCAVRGRLLHHQHRSLFAPLAAPRCSLRVTEADVKPLGGWQHRTMPLWLRGTRRPPRSFPVSTLRCVVPTDLCPPSRRQGFPGLLRPPSMPGCLAVARHTETSDPRQTFRMWPHQPHLSPSSHSFHFVAHLRRFPHSVACFSPHPDAICPSSAPSHHLSAFPERCFAIT